MQYGSFIITRVRGIEGCEIKQRERMEKRLKKEHKMGETRLNMTQCHGDQKGETKNRMI